MSKYRWITAHLINRTDLKTSRGLGGGFSLHYSIYLEMLELQQATAICQQTHSVQAVNE